MMHFTTHRQLSAAAIDARLQLVSFVIEPSSAVVIDIPSIGPRNCANGALSFGHAHGADAVIGERLRKLRSVDELFAFLARWTWRWNHLRIHRRRRQFATRTWHSRWNFAWTHSGNARR